MSKAVHAAREVPPKSTNVRATLWLTRSALAVLAWISTTWAGRYAEALFFTPPRPRKSRAVLPAGGLGALAHADLLGRDDDGRVRAAPRRTVLTWAGAAGRRAAFSRASTEARARASAAGSRKSRRAW